VEGKTVEDAVREGCIQLQVSPAQVRVVILDLPRKGFMGLFGKKARVRVEAVRIQDEVSAFLHELIKKMKVDVTISVQEPTPKSVVFMLNGEDIALLIGKNGQTLESLQYLVDKIFFTKLKKQKMKVYLDANGYRKRKEKFLVGLAERTGDLVLRTKKKFVLDAMPANERKIVHSTLQGKAHLRTQSIGEDPQRCVVIHWKS
jgi:spoIIIJ-associated protein